MSHFGMLVESRIINPSFQNMDGEVTQKLNILYERYVLPMIQQATSTVALNRPFALTIEANTLVMDLIEKNDAVHYLIDHYYRIFTEYLNSVYQDLSNLTGCVLLFEFQKQFEYFSKFAFGMNQIYRKLNNAYTSVGHGSGSVVTEGISMFNKQLFVRVFPRLRDACLDTVTAARQAQSIEPTLQRALKVFVEVTLLCATIVQTPAFDLKRTVSSSNPSEHIYEWTEAPPPPRNSINMVGGPRVKWIMDPVAYQSELEAPLLRSSLISFNQINVDNIILKSTAFLTENSDTQNLAAVDDDVVGVVDEIIKLYVFELSFTAKIFSRDTFHALIDSFVSIFITRRFNFLLSSTQGKGFTQSLKEKDHPRALHILRLLQLSAPSKKQNISDAVSTLVAETASSYLNVLSSETVGSVVEESLFRLVKYLVFMNQFAMFVKSAPVPPSFSSIVTARMDPNFFVAAIDHHHNSNSTTTTTPVGGGFSGSLVTSLRPSSVLKNENTDQLSAISSAAAQLVITGCVEIVREAVRSGIGKACNDTTDRNDGLPPLARLVPQFFDKVMRKGFSSSIMGKKNVTSSASDEEIPLHSPQQEKDLIFESLVSLVLACSDRDILLEGLRGGLSKRLLLNRENCTAENLISERSFVRKLRKELGFIVIAKLDSIIADAMSWKPWTNDDFKSIEDEERNASGKNVKLSKSGGGGESKAKLPSEWKEWESSAIHKKLQKGDFIPTDTDEFWSEAAAESLKFAMENKNITINVMRSNAWIARDDFSVSLTQTSSSGDAQQTDQNQLASHHIFSPSRYHPFGHISAAYSSFYNQRHSGRRLLWLPSLSMAEIATVPGRKSGMEGKSVTLVMSTIQAALLLLFNHDKLFKDESDDGCNRGILVSDAAQLTGIPIAEVARNLVSLSVGNTQKVLVKHSNHGAATETSSAEGYKDVRGYTLFSVNKNYLCDKARVTVQTVKKEEVSDANETPELAKQGAGIGGDIDQNNGVNLLGGNSGANTNNKNDSSSVGVVDEVALMKDRKFVLDAAIIRIMKSLRKCNITELYNKLVDMKDLLGFKPERLQYDIQIVALTEKDFLEKSEADENILIYVP